MSRRYGRNQKRKARAVIAALDSERQQALAHAERLAQTSLRQAYELELVRDALGPSFVGLPIHEIEKLAGPGRDDFRMLAPGGNAVTMRQMTVDSLDDVLSDRLHMRVRLADGTASYAISMAALLHSPPEFMARQLASEIAPALLTEIRKRWRR